MEGAIKFILKYLALIVTAFAAGCVFWLFPPTTQVPIVWFVGVVFALALLCLMLLEKLVTNIFQEKESPLPKLRIVSQEFCIFEPSELFSSQVFASVYQVGEIERLIGFGKVETIIGKNKNIQFRVTEFEENYNLDWLKNNSASIILKPTTPYDAFERIAQLSSMNSTGPRIVNGESNE